MSEELTIERIRAMRAEITDDAGRCTYVGRTTKTELQNIPVIAPPARPPVAYVADMRDAEFFIFAPAAIDFLLAKLEEMRDHDHCELCEKSISEQRTFSVCGPCYNACHNDAVRDALADAEVSIVERMFTEVMPDVKFVDVTPKADGTEGE